MTKMLVGCLALLSLAAGCASAPPMRKVKVTVVEQGNLAAAQRSPDKTYVCEAAHKPGSTIPSSVCQTLRQRELEREAAQDVLRRAAMQPAGRP